VVVVRDEVTTDTRADAERGEQSVRRRTAGHGLRIAIAGQQRNRHPVRMDILEDLRSGTPGVESGKRNGRGGIFLRGVKAPEGHQALGFTEGQRMPKNGIGNAEDDRARGNADCQRRDDQRSHAWPAGEETQGEPQS